MLSAAAIGAEEAKAAGEAQGGARAIDAFKAGQAAANLQQQQALTGAALLAQGLRPLQPGFAPMPPPGWGVVQAPALPDPAALPPARSKQDRLLELKSLLNAGLIDEAEFGERKKAILEEI